MNRRNFKLSDGRDAAIEYHFGKDRPTYDVIIDGKIIVKNAGCGLGWNESVIEARVREKYDKKPGIPEIQKQNIQPAEQGKKQTAGRLKLKNDSLSMRIDRMAFKFKANLNGTKLQDLMDIKKEMSEINEAAKKPDISEEVKARVDILNGTYDNSQYKI